MECAAEAAATYIYIVTVIPLSKDRSPSASGSGLDAGVPGQTMTLCFAGWPGTMSLLFLLTKEFGQAEHLQFSHLS